MINILAGWLRTEPTRFVGYGVAATLQLVLYLGRAAGIDVPSEVQSGLTVFATFVFTEVIRAIVSSPATVTRLTTIARLTPTRDEIVVPPPA